MLDRVEDENVGEMYSFGFSSDEGPKARNCLTALQKKLIEELFKPRG
jgi:hypothetical protein